MSAEPDWMTQESAEALAYLAAHSEAPTLAGAPGTGLVRMSDVEPENVRWLWPGRIPFGKLTVLDGAPKVGKSTLALDLGARVTNGRSMPDGSGSAAPGSVVLMTAEDGLADTVRKRLDAAGADCSRVFALEAVPVVSEEGSSYMRMPSLPDDIGRVESVVDEKGAVLVIIDVLMAYLSSTVKSHNDQDVRRALMPLAKMAERTGAAVLVLRHPRKGGGTALEAGGGSIGIVGAARSVLVAAIDPDDEARRVLAVAACNIAAPAPALAFELETDLARDCARIVWHGVTAHSADDLTRPRDEEDRTAQGEAADFLRDLLADGPVPSKKVHHEADQAGIARATLTRAKSRLGIKPAKHGAPGEKGQGWSWALPADDPHQEPEESEDAQPPDPSTFGTDEHLRDASLFNPEAP